jgi:predicted nuclease of predicted toxin-antitoxin system
MSQFKTDENLPIEVAESLRQAGHDVQTVLDQSLGGEPDPRIAEVCRDEGRILVTLDLDFSDIRTYPPAAYPGLIVLRPATQTITNLTRLISQVITLLATEPLAGRLWIVDESQVRIRE